MPNETVVATGDVTIASAGEQTGRYLNQVSTLITQTNHVVDYTGFYPTADAVAFGGPFTLAVSAASTNPSNPSNNGSPGYLYGFGAKEIVIAPNQQSKVTVASFTQAVANASDNVIINAASPNNLVDSFGNNDTIGESGQAATIAAGGTGNNVGLYGTGQYLFTDSGATGTYNELSNSISGAGNVLVIGSYGTDQPTIKSGVSTVQLTTYNYLELLDPSAQSQITLHGGANTINAIAGSSTITAATGNDIYMGAGGNTNTLFVGASGAVVGVSTVMTGSGNSVIFAKSGVDYTAGSGSDTYVGGSIVDLQAAHSVAGATFSHSTITGTTGHDILFGGTVGDLYNVGGATDLLVNGGGVDTVTGGSTAPVLFSGNSGDDRLINTHSGAFLVANGSADTIDASGASQGNAFFINNAPTIGNTTLVGSTATPSATTFDEFVVTSVAGANYTPHTITIEDFQPGAAIFLGGYSAADDKAFGNAVTAHPTQGGSLAVTLSDNTTIQFIGNHPTQSFNGGTVAV